MCILGLFLFSSAEKHHKPGDVSNFVELQSKFKGFFFLDDCAHLSFTWK